VLSLVAGGASNAEVARSLFLSPGTVHWHTVRIYQKIGASGRAGAAAYAVRHGLAKQG
jgi:DNA-binding CsgD family transcriptional regulator